MGQAGLTLFDLVLAAMLLWLAWSCMSAPDLFTGVVLFMVFGLLMAITWVRLGAADVALAEAGVGSGVTGVLLLEALGRLRRRDDPGRPEDGRPRPSALLGAMTTAALALGMFAALAIALKSVSGTTATLAGVVEAHMPHSGVSSRVTAVLLNFRGYDTLLEVAVLALAGVGVWSLRSTPDSPVEELPAFSGPVLTALVRGVVPVLLLLCVFLVWKGGHSHGGAFPAAALAAAAVILLLLANRRVPKWCLGWPWRTAVASGLVAFAGLALLVAAGDGRLLEYPTLHAGQLMLGLEVVLTASIAAVLVTLLTGELVSHRDDGQEGS